MKRKNETFVDRCEHPEILLARERGLVHEYLKEFRREHLTHGEDFDVVGGNVLYSRSGVEKLDRVLKVSRDEAQAAERAFTEPKKEASAAPGGFVTVRVVRPFEKNRKAVSCAVQGREQPVVVRVQDNANFVSGMELAVIRINDGFYDFTGRLPRAKGRW